MEHPLLAQIVVAATKAPRLFIDIGFIMAVAAGIFWGGKIDERMFDHEQRIASAERQAATEGLIASEVAAIDARQRIVLETITKMQDTDLRTDQRMSDMDQKLEQRIGALERMHGK